VAAFPNRAFTMRICLFAVLTGSCLLATPALSETRLFVIANAPDAYGVDQCLATGASCGKLVANSYCQSQDFAQAASFKKLERDDITNSVASADGSGWRLGSGAFVAIECTR
jgi:hypothetical protein